MNDKKLRGFAEKTALLLIFCTCILLGMSAAAATATVAVDDSAAQGLSPGDTFSVPVTLDSDGDIVSSLSVELMYDPSAVSVAGITQNGLFGTVQNTDYIIAQGSGDDGAGTIYYGIVGTSTTAGVKDGDFITVEFEVLPATANGSYPLELGDVELLYGAIPFTTSTEDGVVTVGEDVVVVDEYPEVYVFPATIYANTGDTFEAKVKLDSDGEIVSALYVELAYDPSVLSVVGITQNGLFGAVESTDYILAQGSGDDGAGTIIYGIAGTTAEAKAGDFITVEFEVLLSAADGSYSLDLMNVELLNGADEVSDAVVTDGAVEITNIPNVVPDPEIISHTDGEIVSQVEIVEVSDASGEDDIMSTTVEIFADLNEDCTADDVGEDWVVIGTDTDGTDGWKVVLDTTTVPDGKYLVRATMDDGRDTGFYTVCVTVYNPDGILLQPGWNFISVPEALENPGVNDVLADFDSTIVDTVLYDDISSGTNSMVIPTEFEPLKGYWVHNNLDEDIVILEEYLQKATTMPTTPASLHLYPGWNAIGHTALDEQSAEVALVAIDGCYIKVRGPWVPSANEYAYIGLNIDDGSELTGNFVTTADFKLDAYEGFYVLVQEECLLG
ncbi:cohesin domain-containing protein [Methanolobus profundi]|uniref:Cohesin domain-containing protein n=1 Tax=Methanolobus profundi TaxID=487685 RepID=A0A1I4P698_9EURY|nr:cohesin domain-containing protein [Methanolobus profundi]SFM23338.1 Cohesin domain-containing protein [Methanolobus profundi]